MDADTLKSVWMDLTAQFKLAVRDGDEERKKQIISVIYNLERIYPWMTDWYMHTKPGEDHGS